MFERPPLPARRIALAALPPSPPRLPFDSHCQGRGSLRGLHRRQCRATPSATSSWNRRCKKTAEVGLHYVEFFRNHVPVNSTPEQIKSVLKLCGDHDINPVAFGVEPSARITTRTRRSSSSARPSASST